MPLPLSLATPPRTHSSSVQYILILLTAFIGLSLIGCASATYHDPFDPALSRTAQSATGNAPAGPSLRVVLAGSTAASMKDLADLCNLAVKLLNPASTTDSVDPKHFQEDLNQALAPYFRSIEYTYWDAPENRSQVDYILTLEIRAKYGGH